jgi:hypothetical protein
VALSQQFADLAPMFHIDIRDYAFAGTTIGLIPYAILTVDLTNRARHGGRILSRPSGFPHPNLQP